MPEEDINWYRSILLLTGAILSFADPITDILTLVEFYRSDHKTWFYVGLTFVLLPCLVFPWLYFGVRNETLSQYSGTRKFWQTLVCGFHPFSAAFARLEGFVLYCLSKCSHGDEEQEPYVLGYIDMAVVFESVLESAPQFIFQLYVICQPDQEVKLIQKSSIPISFVSLVWALTILDNMLYQSVQHGNLNLKRRAGVLVANLLGLGIRLPVILLFTLRFKWWIVVAMLSHNFVMLTADILCYADSGKFNLGIIAAAVLNFCLYWIKDDVSLLHFVGVVDPARLEKQAKRQVFSFVWFVLENMIMILLCLWLGEDISFIGFVASTIGVFLPIAVVTSLRVFLILD